MCFSIPQTFTFNCHTLGSADVTARRRPQSCHIIKEKLNLGKNKKRKKRRLVEPKKAWCRHTPTTWWKTVGAGCLQMCVSIWMFASWNCGTGSINGWPLANGLTVTAECCRWRPNNTQTVVGVRSGRGQRNYCPMTLLTNESSSSSSLIPTNWSTTSPPRIAITVGTADTCRRGDTLAIKQL